MDENTANKTVVDAVKKAAIGMLKNCRATLELQIASEEDVDRLSKELQAAEIVLAQRRAKAEDEYKSAIKLYRLSGENFKRSGFSYQAVRAAFNLPNTRGNNSDPIEHRAADRVARWIVEESKKDVQPADLIEAMLGLVK